MTKPLLFMSWVLVVFILSACGSHSDRPQFSASGYIADYGVVRLWRQDDSQQQPHVLLSVYSPYSGGYTRVTYYDYINGNLREIHRDDIGNNSQGIEIRFDEQGKVSFMQRQLASRREPLTADDIAFHQFEAKRQLELSNALRAGKIVLRQGQWDSGRVTTCAGDTQRLSLDESSQLWLEKRGKNTQRPLGIAWLDSPKGQQLLLVANEDFCRWEPKAGSL